MSLSIPSFFSAYKANPEECDKIIYSYHLAKIERIQLDYLDRMKKEDEMKFYKFMNFVTEKK